MLFEIKHWNGSLIVTQEADSLRGALELLVLSDADLRGAVLRGAVLRGAVLNGAVLNGAVLSGAVLSDANLSGANLRGANLRGADLRNADTYKVEQLHMKMLEAIDAGGALEMGDWHTCETTHCRAGWAIHLAGKPGRLLESIYGPAMAGALIHQASCPWLEKVPDFYASNTVAMADIRACAAREQKEASK
jgi:uncharacterized protein YjbI with pentapeptide repeats